LTVLTMPSHYEKVGNENYDVFEGVKKLVRLELVGSTLTDRIVANLRDCLAPGAIVVGRELAGQSFGNTPIVAG
jgi:hypothetical protein